LILAHQCFRPAALLATVPCIRIGSRGNRRSADSGRSRQRRIPAGFARFRRRVHRSLWHGVGAELGPWIKNTRGRRITLRAPQNLYPSRLANTRSPWSGFDSPGRLADKIASWAHQRQFTVSPCSLTPHYTLRREWPSSELVLWPTPAALIVLLLYRCT